MKEGRRLHLFGLLVLAAASVAFIGVERAGPAWSTVLVTPWALVLTGIAFVAAFDEALLEEGDSWVGPASHVLAGASVAFVGYEVLVPSYGDVVSWPLNAREAGLAFLAVVCLVGAGWAVGRAFLRRDRRERLQLVGSSMLLFGAGSVPGLGLLPAVTVIALQIVLFAWLLGVPLSVRDVLRATAGGLVVLVVGIVGLVLAYGQISPPKLGLDDALTTRWVLPLTAAVAIAFLGGLVWAWPGETESAR